MVCLLSLDQASIAISCFLQQLNSLVDDLYRVIVIIWLSLEDYFVVGHGSLQSVCKLLSLVEFLLFHLEHAFKILTLIIKCINLLLVFSNLVGVLRDLIGVEVLISDIVLVILSKEGVFLGDSNLTNNVLTTLNDSVSSSKATNNYPKSNP